MSSEFARRYVSQRVWNAYEILKLVVSVALDGRFKSEEAASEIKRFSRRRRMDPWILPSRVEFRAKCRSSDGARRPLSARRCVTWPPLIRCESLIRPFARWEMFIPCFRITNACGDVNEGAAGEVIKFRGGNPRRATPPIIITSRAQLHTNHRTRTDASRIYVSIIREE